MIEGIKIRGADNTPNFIIVDDLFHIVTPELVSYEFVICSDTKNLNFIGYSKPLKLLYVEFQNNKRYIYRNIDLDVWQSRYSFDTMSNYYAHKIKSQGFTYCETDEYIKRIPNQMVLDYLDKLDYYKTITEGLYATDRPDKVIDTENTLFELTF